MINLAKYRISICLEIDHSAFIFVLAQTLASCPAGRYKVKARFVTWHSLDRLSLVRAVADAGIARLGTDDDLIERAIGFVKSTTAMGSDEAGRRLKLTAEERDLLSIRTIEAFDETRADREARRIEERRIRDAERKRQLRARKPRAEWLATSLSVARPWEALGVSRRTYERKRKAILVAGVSGQTNISVAGVSVSQVCPQTHIINGCADTLATTGAFPAPASSLQRSDSSICPSDGADRQTGLFGEKPSSSREHHPDPADDEMAAREEIIALLGGGDLRRGRLLAEFVPEKAMAHLVAAVAAEGIVPSAEAISTMARMAREAAAREAISAPTSSNLMVQT